MDKLKANMAAAKMLYPSSLRVLIKGGGLLSIQHEPKGIKNYFNLFTNPSDLVAVVKCLGEKYSTYIVFDNHKKVWTSCYCHDDADYEFERATYEEAVAAACIATQEGA